MVHILFISPKKIGYPTVLKGVSNREWDVGASHRGRGTGALVCRWGINVAVLGHSQSGSMYRLE